MPEGREYPGPSAQERLRTTLEWKEVERGRDNFIVFVGEEPDAETSAVLADNGYVTERLSDLTDASQRERFKTLMAEAQTLIDGQHGHLALLISAEAREQIRTDVDLQDGWLQNRRYVEIVE